MFILVSLLAFSFLNCDETTVYVDNFIGGSNVTSSTIRYLVSKPYISCDDKEGKEYNEIKMIAIITITLFVIILPLIVYSWSFYMKRKMDKYKSNEHNNNNNNNNNQISNTSSSFVLMQDRDQYVDTAVRIRNKQIHSFISKLLWGEYRSDAYWWSAIQRFREFALAIALTQPSFFRFVIFLFVCVYICNININIT